MNWTDVLGFSAVAAVLTFGLHQGAEYIKKRRAAKHTGMHNSLYVALALERFARDCAMAIADDQTVRASSGSAGKSLAELPLFVLPSNVDWSALDVVLLNRIHSFPDYKSQADSAIQDAFENLCGDDWTDEQQLQAGLYGHKALLLAAGIRQRYKLGSAI